MVNRDFFPLTVLLIGMSPGHDLNGALMLDFIVLPLPLLARLCLIVRFNLMIS